MKNTVGYELMRSLGQDDFVHDSLRHYNRK